MPQNRTHQPARPASDEPLGSLRAELQADYQRCLRANATDTMIEDQSLARKIPQQSALEREHPRLAALYDIAFDSAADMRARRRAIAPLVARDNAQVERHCEPELNNLRMLDGAVDMGNKIGRAARKLGIF